jgi:hypothetical protein
MSRFRRLAGVAFVLILVSSWAAAAPRDETRPSREKPTVSSSAETLFSRLRGWLTRVGTKTGCGSDPSGCPKSSRPEVSPLSRDVDGQGNQ